MSKHTKVPWVRLYGTEIRPTIKPDETLIAEVLGADRRFEEEDVNDECVANAEFIVRAVNCHDQLVEALQSLVFWFGNSNSGSVREADLMRDARTALGKATGEEVLL